MSNLKCRLALIGVLVLVSVWALFPRNVNVRQRRADGTFFDTTTYRGAARRGSTCGRHAPRARGRRSQGRRRRTRARRSIARSRSCARASRGSACPRPSIQKAGNDRIIVEIPGHRRSASARIKIVAGAGVPRVPDHRQDQAFEKVAAAPRCDREAEAASAAPRARRPRRRRRRARASAVCSPRQGHARKDAAQADSGRATARRPTATSLPGAAGGAISKLHPGGPDARPVPRSSARNVRRARSSSSQTRRCRRHCRRARSSASATTRPSSRTRRIASSTCSTQRPIITGEYLTDAKPNQTPDRGHRRRVHAEQRGRPPLPARDGEARRDYMAIVLDKRRDGRPPVINSAIGTRGQITMGQGRDLQAAQDLALVLKAGALPVPLRVAEVRNIGPSLGADSINKGITRRRRSRIVLVVVIMVVLLPLLGLARRRRPRALRAVHARRCSPASTPCSRCPGLAGFVLSIGIAVDANVLIFERIREELDRGKTVRTAIDEGFRHAMQRDHRLQRRRRSSPPWCSTSTAPAR